MIPFLNSDKIFLLASLKLNVTVFGLSEDCFEISSSKDTKLKAGSLFGFRGSNR